MNYRDVEDAISSIISFVDYSLNNANNYKYWINILTKLLNPGYCYPVGFDLPFERKISGVSKQAKFDVKSFKTNNVELNFFQKVYRFLDAKLFPNFKYMRDKIFFKNIK